MRLERKNSQITEQMVKLRQALKESEAQLASTRQERIATLHAKAELHKQVEEVLEKQRNHAGSMIIFEFDSQLLYFLDLFVCLHACVVASVSCI